MATNTTLNTAQTTGVNQTHFDRQLLAKAKTHMVHALYGQKRPIPLHNGKQVNFPRFD